jgi:hypothetical protein
MTLAHYIRNKTKYVATVTLYSYTDNKKSSKCCVGFDVGNDNFRGWGILRVTSSAKYT